MNRRQPFDGFEFQEYAFVDDEVGPISDIDADTSVHERDRRLAHDPKTERLKLVTEAFSVSRFEETGS